MQPVQIKKPQTFSYSKESAIQYGIYDFYHHKKKSSCYAFLRKTRMQLKEESGEALVNLQ